jgi:ADP-ribose pyrophosphatase YjhB (NUDIX family)
MKDIEIKNDEFNFRFRVGAIIIHDGKILGVENTDNGYFLLPGGHLQLGEVSSDAVVREVNEELNIEIKIVKDVLFAEHTFINRDSKKVHELGSYYLVEPIDSSKLNTNDYIITENDHGTQKKLNFRWFNLEELKNADFRPSYVKEIILNQDYNFKHLIINKI